MLQRTPVTAEDLGITGAELYALLRVRTELATGRLPHLEKFEDYARYRHALDMNSLLRREGNCLVGCAGAWMTFFDHSLPRCIEDHSPALQRLYFPHEVRNWDDITAAETIEAIDKFLNNQSPWEGYNGRGKTHSGSAAHATLTPREVRNLSSVPMFHQERHRSSRRVARHRNAQADFASIEHYVLGRYQSAVADTHRMDILQGTYTGRLQTAVEVRAASDRQARYSRPRYINPRVMEEVQ